VKPLPTWHFVDVIFSANVLFAPFAAIGWRPARVFSHLESKHRQAQHALTERTFFVVRYVKAVS
jgi:hypothetical protein